MFRRVEFNAMKKISILFIVSLLMGCENPDESSNNNSDYIEITAFSKETVTEGEWSRVSFDINYCLRSKTNGSINIGFNYNDPKTWEMGSYAFINNSCGTESYNLEILPVDWGDDVSFSMKVSLTEFTDFIGELPMDNLLAEDSRDIDVYSILIKGAWVSETCIFNNELWQSYALNFTPAGNLAVDTYYYQNNACSNSPDSINYGEYSQLVYTLGASVINADGTVGQVLLFPDPEHVGPYGSVFSLIENRLCFANETVSINESSFLFTPAGVADDLQGLNIDYENCFIHK